MTTTALRTNAAPIYIQIAESIRRRIRSGKLRPGEQLESERQISGNFGVSLMTVRQALQGLEEEGLIERKHGSGTFVRTPPIDWNRLMGFTEQMAAQDTKAGSKWLACAIISAEPALAEQLQTSPGTPLLKIERLRLAGEEPVAVETCFLPQDLFPALEKKLVDRTSLFDLVEKDYRVRISHAEESIEAKLADRRIAKLLGITTLSPVLFLRQRLFADGKQPVAISTGWYRADKNAFKLTRRR
jgi:GntR family transcriptional regulator